VPVHVPVPVTVAVVGDATVDRRGSHHRHDGLPAQGGLKAWVLGIWNWLSAGIEGVSCHCNVLYLGVVQHVSSIPSETALFKLVHGG
jgi:hypothetical protein